MKVSRADRSSFAHWWWTVDRYLLAALLTLMISGVVLSFAASPPIAERLGLDSYHFVFRHILFAVPAVLLLIGISFLNERQVRRLAMLLLVGGLVLMVATLLVGFEAKGARRWISIAGFSIQPSEFVKPGFVVICAWLFSEGSKRPDIHGHAIAVGLLVLVCSLLILQPDFGQTMLVAMVWSGIFFLAGMPWFFIIGLALLSVAGIFTAYTMIPHVAGRIDRFLNPEGGDTFQVDTALESFTRGGWFGRGPGEGTVKNILPDSHTDFIFAVAAEEYGIIICLVLLALFTFVVMRGFSHALKEHNAFTRLATSGLIALFGVQSVINMAVNLHLMPSKGMTLPFVSYGGSSMMAVAIGMGMVLALTRKRLDTSRLVFHSGLELRHA
ncbi:putative lipid II flippase FtsW [Pararhizobium sp. IMCC21322]|uniref:putative lipid II flippase FtsW n=1 Tax=Pararhizobium sp. IMCC21322 TaxID=3067903 RepID=UPI0027424C21|nr:putative lipid II flippase FtsW [Pararhizobium sp. IMCC21322]